MSIAHIMYKSKHFFVTQSYKGYILKTNSILYLTYLSSGIKILFIGVCCDRDVIFVHPKLFALSVTAHFLFIIELIRGKCGGC